MIKLCFISPTFPYMNCGVGDYTLELIKSLKNTECEIGVITSNHNKIKQFIASSLNEKFSLFPIVKRWDFRNVSIILNKIKDLNPDIIHIQYHWWNSNDGFILKGIMMVLLPFILKARKIKVPIVTTLHSRLNGAYLFPKAAFLRRWSLLPLLLFSDRILVTNKFDGRQLSRRFPFLRNKVDFATGGAGHYLKDKNLNGEVSKIKSQLKISGDEIILSNFGFMIPYKGLEELLEAMSSLRKKGYPLRLLAIGGFDIEVNFAGPYFDKLQKLVESLGLGPYVKWTGFCDYKQTSLFLLASDICVMPFLDGASEWRSSFLGVLSHGLPVVTTRTKKTPEELIDRVNCMLVPPKDPTRLATAIEELIVAPEFRKSLGRAARELYNSEYDWSIIAQKTLKAYKNAQSVQKVY